MDPKWSEPIRKFRETVIRELQKGKESATQLQTLLKNPAGDGVGSVSAEELTLQISTSFDQSISILSSCGVNELRQIVATADAAVGDSSGDRRSKTSDHSRKKLGVKDRRGCYRRRNVSQSWITVSPTVEDEHAWRKYGQKEILNTNFPRCYFRCTHKNDQGCKATKQVQMIKEEPRLYQTTYFGHHTCQDTTALLTAPQFISDSDPMESNLLSFGLTKTPTTKHYQDPICPNYAKPTTSTAPVNIHQEFKDETHSDVSDNKSCLDSSPMLQDVITANSESSEFLKSSKINGANHYHEEVVSSVQRSCSSTPLPDLDMEAFDTEFDAIDVDDALYFDDMPGFFQGFS